MTLILWLVVAFVVGILAGVGGFAYVVAKDDSLVSLAEDEQVIKRPHPDLILVAVTPDVARRLVNYGGELSAPNPTEARALYPERIFRAVVGPPQQNDAPQNEKVQKS